MQTLNRDELKRMNEVDHEDFVDTVAEVAGSKDRQVVVYCASYDCDASPNAARKLEDAGFTSVYDYEGGTKDWFGQKQ